MKLPSLLRSILSVLAGFVTVFALSMGTDIVMESTGILPPATEPEAYMTWMLALAVLAYPCVWLGGKLGAKN